MGGRTGKKNSPAATPLVRKYGREEFMKRQGKGSPGEGAFLYKV